MPMISVDFELGLPNDFLVDHSQSEGNTRTFTYHGPDKLFLQLSKETKTEALGPLTEEDMHDGRPIPEECYIYEVDCVTNPLICQLRAPIIDELQESREGEEIFHPESPEIEGYPRMSYQLPLMPEDIYNARSVKDVDGTLTIDTWSISEKMLDKPELLTWDDVRTHRDMMLVGSDGQIAEDMPESIKDAWKLYRTRLRELPAVMQANNVPPSVAFYMFPEQPFV